MQILLVAAVASIYIRASAPVVELVDALDSKWDYVLKI